MTAIYTSARPGHQAQSLAFSRDNGRTFTRYAHNPVLDIGAADFRDPKVFRHDDAWIMAVALATERTVSLYRSHDLRDWTHLSDFTRPGEGIWECPDLFPLGGRWVLLLSELPGGMRYVVGDFDGTAFTGGDLRPFDHGDLYAAVTYEGVPDRRIAIGWLGGDSCRMSAPRELTLEGDDADPAPRARAGATRHPRRQPAGAARRGRRRGLRRRDGAHAAGLISPDPRTISRVGTTTRRAGASAPSSRANSSSAAQRPSATGSCATTVSPGCSTSASVTSSNATRATVCCSPRSRSARRAPIVIRFCPVTSAVGRSLISSVRGGGVGHVAVRQLEPLERAVVRRAAAPRGSPARGRAGGQPLAVAEIADPPVAGGEQVLGRRAHARGVVADHGVGVDQSRRRGR